MMTEILIALAVLGVLALLGMVGALWAIAAALGRQAEAAKEGAKEGAAALDSLAKSLDCLARIEAQRARERQP